jgi:hypothetical protein
VQRELPRCHPSLRHCLLGWKERKKKNIRTKEERNIYIETQINWRYIVLIIINILLLDPPYQHAKKIIHLYLQNSGKTIYELNFNWNIVIFTILCLMSFFFKWVNYWTFFYVISYA